MQQFKEGIGLAKFSHYKIGGPARFFFEAKTEQDVEWAIKEAKQQKLKVFVMGGATNVLINDEGFDGLVLRVNIEDLKIKKETVSVGAGVLMADLLKETAKKSLAGLEWAGGLPGTVGGAIRGNAGCFGGEMKDNVISVRSLDIKTMKIAERPVQKCGFDYRDSIYKMKSGSEIILSATLALTKGNKKDIEAVIKERVTYRKEHHPMEHPNIGSMFKNVPLRAIHAMATDKYKDAVRDATLVYKGSTFSIKTDPFPVVSAAKLISESGLDGVSTGGAMISPKHPNFIVNTLAATSADVSDLMQLAKAEVKRKFGIALEEEVQTI